MNKKLLVSLFLCFLVFASGLLAQKKGEEAKTIQFLLRDDVVSPYYYIVPNWEENVCDKNVFNSGPIIMGSVPPSPKAEAIFFEFWFNYCFGYFHYCPVVNTKGWLQLEIINPDVIPLELEVLCSTEYFWFYEDKYPDDLTDTEGLREGTISDKYCLFRDNIWFWKVRNKVTKIKIPEQEAISIINKLINKGFDIQFYFYGMLKGSLDIEFGWLSVEVNSVQ